MKIVLEDSDNKEIEITIKGDITSEKVGHIISLLKSSNISSKIIVFDEEREMLLNISNIYYFEIIDRRTFAITNNGRYICKYTLMELFSLFKSQGIVQIGKSVLVNINHIKSLEAEFSGNYVVNLSNNEKVIASRFFMKDFRKAIMEG